MIVQGPEYTPAPEGLHDAVCVDVIDKGMVETPWGNKHKLRILWELDLLMPEDSPGAKPGQPRRFLVGKTYSASLHSKSTLTTDLVAWRGKPFSPDELRGFDTEKLIGANCKLLVQHTVKDGTVYANVKAILKATKRPLMTPTPGYQRAKALPPQTEPKPRAAVATTVNNLEDEQDEPARQANMPYEEIPF